MGNLEEVEKQMRKGLAAGSSGPSHHIESAESRLGRGGRGAGGNAVRLASRSAFHGSGYLAAISSPQGFTLAGAFSFSTTCDFHLSQFGPVI